MPAESIQKVVSNSNHEILDDRYEGSGWWDQCDESLETKRQTEPLPMIADINYCEQGLKLKSALPPITDILYNRQKSLLCAESRSQG